MLLIAFRTEYQITVDRAQNRIFYQNFGPMRTAAALPHYRDDWNAALAEVQPGFCILTDMQIVNENGGALLAEFQAVEQLIVQRGVHLVAEVHLPGLPTRRYTDAVTTRQAMPVEYFLDIWDATQFLDQLQLHTNTAA
ncbi:hypothetical protein [Hymenobacter properus]|uniref:Uncharacterized protein n=1 Tax=Hymenobacter properus TaxID=2791026 RepID=A0A931BHW2_9BACT|nr:hypothetical protein [Hymenobacter properus]MBF9141881.1 hypothetical protein [Hymenobacter properus]MBR7720689.1 hypothetical protein [Microvirga sp. SRT04]